MITVAIKDNKEPNVVQLTYENLFKELKDIPGSDLCVVDDWFQAIPRAIKKKNNYVCFVEADCLVNSGYFTSMMGLLKKSPYFKKIGVLASGVGVNNWANKFYGYSVGSVYSDGVIPNRDKKSNTIYPIQVGFVPGAIIRVNMFQKALKELKAVNGLQNDLVMFSTAVSFAIWRQGDGNRVHISPGTTYVSTEDYINDIAHFDPKPGTLITKFKKEVIS